MPSQSKGRSNEYLTKLFAGCLCFAEILGPVLGHEPPLQAGQATVLSDHTSQTNWTFGVMICIALCDYTFRVDQLMDCSHYQPIFMPVHFSAVFLVALAFLAQIQSRSSHLN